MCLASTMTPLTLCLTSSYVLEIPPTLDPITQTSMLRSLVNPWNRGQFDVGYRPQALLATMEPKSDVRWLRSTSGYLLVPTGACWCLLVPTGAYWSLKPSGHSSEVAHDDSIDA